MFRESLRREAERRGVAGWTRNLPDGRVEAVLEGLSPAVQAVEEWCRRGPPDAVVIRLDCREEAGEGAVGFRVIR